MNNISRKKYVISFVTGILIGTILSLVIFTLISRNSNKGNGTMDFDSKTSVATKAETEGESFLSDEEYSYTLEHVTLSSYGTCTYDKLSFTGPYNGIPKINESLEEKYNEFADSIKSDDNIDDEDDNSYNGYIEDALEFGVDVSDYCDICKVADVWKSDKYLCITFMTEWYAGGYHGFHRTYGITYDLETGNEVNLSDIPLSDNQTDIKELLIKYIEIYASVEDSSIQGSAKDNAIEMVNGNVDEIAFFIDNEGFELYFNEYEINCYAAGPTKITIPIDEFELE